MMLEFDYEAESSMKSHDQRRKEKTIMTSAIAQSEIKTGSTGKLTKKNINIGKTERWISMAAGAALAIYGLSRKSASGKAAYSITGGYLFYRGQTGYDPVYEAFGIDTTKPMRRVTLERTVTINRSPEEVYRYWHNLENLPRFMEHLESVKAIDDRRSHWIARAPGGIRFEWDAETVEDIPGERIRWQSLPDSELQNRGTVEFRRVPGGTRLLFRASYYIPGVETSVAARIFRNLSEKQLQYELNQFKNMIESREVAAGGI